MTNTEKKENEIKKDIDKLAEIIENTYKTDKINKKTIEQIRYFLQITDKYLPRKQYYRELSLIIEKIQKFDEEQRKNYKFIIISDLEKRLNMLKELIN